MKHLTKKWVLTLTKALCVTFALLFGISVFGVARAHEWSSQVDSFFGITRSKFTGKIDPITGVRDPDYQWYFPTEFTNLKDLKKETTRVAEQVAAEGSVLLYNKSALPLAKGSKVSLFSTGSVRPNYGPQGGHGNDFYTNNFTSLRAYTEAGFKVNETLWDRYQTDHGPGAGTGNDANNEYRRNRNAATQTVKFGDMHWDQLYSRGGQALFDTFEEYGDAAIFTWVRTNGENADMYPGAYGASTTPFNQYNAGVDAMKLSVKERSVVKGMCDLRKANKIKKVIINVNSNNMLGMEFMKDPDIGPYVDAVIWTGGTGERGIYAVPKLLNGDYNFSGSMPFTTYYDNWDDPSVGNHYNGTAHNGTAGAQMEFTNWNSITKQTSEEMGLTGNAANTINTAQRRGSYVVYKEGVYVGYRYPETRYFDAVMGRAKTGNFEYKDTIFATFGSGLSYTKFDMSIDSVTYDAAADKYSVKVKVTNTGSFKGKKAVQVYAQKPYNDYNITNEIEIPAVELVGFGKTKELTPNASDIVNVEVERRYLTSYDSKGAKTYIINAGKHYLAVGNDAHDAVNNILADLGKTTSNGMDKNGNKNLTWNDTFTLDKVKYSKSVQTGNEIKNLFDECDWNTYTGKGPEKVKYTTRSDWEGTTAHFNWIPGAGNPTTGVTAAQRGDLTYYTGSRATGYEILSMTQQLYLDERKDFLPEAFDRSTAYPTYGAVYTKDNPYKDKNGNIVLGPDGKPITENLTLVQLMFDKDGKWLAYDDPLWDALLDQVSWSESVSAAQLGFRHTNPVPSIGKPHTFEFNESHGLTAPWNHTQGGYIPGKALAVAFDDPDKTATGSYGDENFMTGMAEAWPNNPVRTATMNVELNYESGALWGDEGLWAGYSGLYGVGANLIRNAYGSRHPEYFSEDPFAGGTICASLVGGIQSKGVNCLIKHFFLNEADLHREGTTIWASEQTYREIYLRMFEIPFTRKTVSGDIMAGWDWYKGDKTKDVTLGGAMNTMCTKGRVGPFNCNAYKPLLTGWLRGEIGMNGFCHTDTPNSGQNSKPAQIKAGCDNSDDDNQNDGDSTNLNSFNAYAPGTGHGEFGWALRESVHHLAYNAAHCNAMNGITSDTRLAAVTPAWEGWFLAMQIILGTLTGLSFALIVFISVLRYKTRESEAVKEVK